MKEYKKLNADSFYKFNLEVHESHKSFNLFVHYSNYVFKDYTDDKQKIFNFTNLIILGLMETALIKRYC